MDELSAVLLDRLVEKTFANMTPEEKLAFVERLFGEMSPKSQEQFLLRLVREVSGAKVQAATHLPIAAWQMGGAEPRNIGPWQMCCRMMADIDRADRLDDLDTAAPTRLFNALADETRLKIIKLLSEKELCVEDLTQALQAAQSTVSHHLRILREAGLIRGDRQGRSIYYSLTHPLQIEIIP